MSALLSVGFVVQIVRISMPYLLAALGGTYSERGGVVNIALEGLMLWGAFGFVLGAFATGSPVVGLGLGVGAGLANAALLALVCVRLGANQIVAGVALNLLALGSTKFLLKMLWDSSSNSARVDSFEPWLEASGGLGPLLELVTHPLILIAAGLVPLAWLGLYRTRFGLRLRACGEHPEAAATVGVAVQRVRWAGVLLSGALAGLAGVWLASDQHQFTDNMTHGRGYIALAAMIVGKWNPALVAAACLLFGAAEALQITLQGAGYGLPTQLLQAIPYLLTLIAVVGFVGRARPPAASGQPYRP